MEAKWNLFPVIKKRGDPERLLCPGASQGPAWYQKECPTHGQRAWAGWQMVPRMALSFDLPRAGCLQAPVNRDPLRAPYGLHPQRLLTWLFCHPKPATSLLQLLGCGSSFASLPVCVSVSGPVFCAYVLCIKGEYPHLSFWLCQIMVIFN